MIAKLNHNHLLNALRIPAKEAAMQKLHAENHTLSLASTSAAMTGGCCSALSICTMEYADSIASPSPLLLL